MKTQAQVPKGWKLDWVSTDNRGGRALEWFCPACLAAPPNGKAASDG